MQANKQALNISKLALAISAAALLSVPVVGVAQAELLNVQVGGLSCGTASAVKVSSTAVVLEDFSSSGNCDLSSGDSNTGGDGDSNTGGDGDSNTGGDGDSNTGGGAIADAMPGGRMGKSWGVSQFPYVQRAEDLINVRDDDGVITKYVYYQVNGEDLIGKHFFGDIAVIQTPSSSGAVFSAWLSASPGGEPVGSRCSSRLRPDSIFKWSTSYSKAPSYTCKVDAPNTYYLNVTDRSYDDFSAGKKGTCSSSRGCTFNLSVSSSPR